jgi:hypothetical protein
MKRYKVKTYYELLSCETSIIQNYLKDHKITINAFILGLGFTKTQLKNTFSNYKTFEELSKCKQLEQHHDVLTFIKEVQK